MVVIAGCMYPAYSVDVYNNNSYTKAIMKYTVSNLQFLDNIGKRIYEKQKMTFKILLYEKQMEEYDLI